MHLFPFYQSIHFRVKEINISIFKSTIFFFVFGKIKQNTFFSITKLWPLKILHMPISFYFVYFLRSKEALHNNYLFSSIKWGIIEIKSYIIASTLLALSLNKNCLPYLPSWGHTRTKVFISNRLSYFTLTWITLHTFCLESTHEQKFI